MEFQLNWSGRFPSGHDGSPGGVRRLAREMIHEHHVAPGDVPRLIAGILWWENDKRPTDAVILEAVRGEAARAREIDDFVNGRAAPSKQVKGAAVGPRQFGFIDSATFAGGDYRPNWLIKNVLVRGQPGVIAGPSKALKTNLSIDLAVSLAAGLPFLGKFDIPNRMGKRGVTGDDGQVVMVESEVAGEPAKVRVAVVSGESGAHTLQETAHRVCKAKGVSLASLNKHLNWCFTLPTFSDFAGMQAFGAELAKLEADVCIIDPVYLALGDIDARNLFEAGAAFRVVSEVLLGAGCTPLLVHHAGKKLEQGQPMELTHLAYTGLEQFARQFILLNRRSEYRDDGTHDLWCRIGGSTGQGGLWSLHIEEGTINENFSGRQWDVTVQTVNEAKEDRVTQREQTRAEVARGKMRADGTRLIELIDGSRESGQEAVTKNRLRELTGFSTARVAAALASLVDEGIIQEVEFVREGGQGAGVKRRGFSRVPK